MPENRRGESPFKSIQTYIALFVILLCTIGIGCIERENFSTLVLLYCISFLAFFSISKNDFSFKQILIFGILIRVGLLTSIPNLSDDFYRFIWDGNLFNSDPKAIYAYTPEDIVGKVDGCNAVLYDQMNSKEYYSIYPPVMQLIFGVSSFLSSGHLFFNVFLLKMFLLLSEFGVIFFLLKLLEILRINLKWCYLYAFNPLVIIEVIGNCHFESMMILFVLWSWYILINNRCGVRFIVMAGLIFGLGIMTKLTCLLFLPILLNKLRWNLYFQFSVGALLCCLISFIPFYSESLFVNFFDSMDLYFRNFEFNASFFYVLNYLYSSLKGYDTVQVVGPILTIITAVFTVILSVKRKTNWINYFMFCLCGYTMFLLMSTTVHPWYIINLVFLSVLTGYRFPVIWSFLIILSYFMYGNGLEESFWILAIEYGVLLVFAVLELSGNRKINSLIQRVPLFQVGDNPK